MFDGMEVLCVGYFAVAEDLPTTSLEERVARGYKLWGSDMPKQGHGQYAAVVYDSSRGSLTLLHDLLGLRSLFYSVTPDSLLAASHLEDLVVETGMGRLDMEYLVDFFATSDHMGRHTPFGHIRRLLPGESVVWAHNILTRHECWTLGTVEEDGYAEGRDSAATVKSFVAEAVKVAVPASGPVWCELSGGLDSAMVLATAERTGRSLGAFSFLYPQSPDSDESRWIRAVLERCPVPWHTVDGSEHHPFGALPDSMWGEPSLALLQTSWNRRYAALLMEFGVTAVLTGLGGDEIFGSNAPKPFHFADMLLRGQKRELADACLRWSQLTSGVTPESLVTRFAVDAAAAWRRRETIDFRPPEIPWASHESETRFGLSERGRWSPLPPAASVGGAWYLGAILQAARAASRTLVERSGTADFRHPLFDVPLVAHLATLPWDERLTPDRPRGLQRDAMADSLPPEFVERMEKPALNGVFTAGLARSPLWRDRLTRNPRLVDLGLIDPQRWSDAVEAVRSEARPMRLGPFLATACLEIWLQQLECSPAHHANTVLPQLA